MESIYLDYNATAPLLPEAREGMRPWLEGKFGNASSTHTFGQAARHAVEGARETIAKLLNCRPSEILFTSGGTESANLAVLGGARGSNRAGKVLASAVEHHCVLNAVHALPSLGIAAELIPVDSQGLIRFDEFRRLAEGPTSLVSVMHANNETGVLQPIAEIGAFCRERKILFHSDAVQTVGKLPLDLSSLPVDLLSASAHKFGGPQGVGFLYVRSGTRLAPLFYGGEQEAGVRPGTENVAGILGMAEALAVSVRRMAAEAIRLAGLRDRLQALLCEALPEAVVQGDRSSRVPNTLSIRFPGVENDVLVIRLDSLGIHASPGAACAAGAVQASHVLLAMGLGEAEARSVLRFSLGSRTTEADIERVGREVPGAVRGLLKAAA